jgi:methionyl-tRNA formyltransferase
MSKIDFKDDHMAAGQLKFLWKSKKLVVTCCDGNSIEIVKVSVGKKVINARDFYNGFLSKIKECERRFE